MINKKRIEASWIEMSKSLVWLSYFGGKMENPFDDGKVCLIWIWLPKRRTQNFEFDLRSSTGRYNAKRVIRAWIHQYFPKDINQAIKDGSIDV